MSRRTPWSPIFDVERSTGDIVVGATPPATTATIVEIDTLTDATYLPGPYRLALDGNTLWVTNSTGSRLTSVDVTDPTAVSVLGGVQDTTNLNGVAAVSVSGSYAFTSHFPTSFPQYSSWASWDISTPSAPTLADTLTAGFAPSGTTQAWASVIIGNTFFGAHPVHDGIIAIDITTPASLSILDSLFDVTNLTDCTRVIASGANHLLCVGSSSETYLTSVDVSTPSAMVIADTLTTSASSTLDVKAVGDKAYVAGFSNDTLSVCDISDLTSMTEVGTLADGTDLDGPIFLGVSASGIAYVFARGSSQSIVPVDCRVPASPEIISTALTSAYGLAGFGDVVVSGSTIFMSDPTLPGIRVFSITENLN